MSNFHVHPSPHTMDSRPRPSYLVDGYDLVRLVDYVQEIFVYNLHFIIRSHYASCIDGVDAQPRHIEHDPLILRVRVLVVVYNTLRRSLGM